jgi:hypothetical protein
MLAERKNRGRPLSRRALGAALVLGLGLAGVSVGGVNAADDPGVVKLAIAVPIVVPASAGEFIDADVLSQYTSEQGILTRQLDAVYGREVALGIDPRIIASIRLLGDTAPASALAWLDRLAAAPNQTFELGYADADVTLQTQAGSATVLQPETFDFAINPALFSATTSTATPSPVPTEVPTSDEILRWPFSLTGIAWPRDNTVVTADLGAISASGYSATILSSDNVARDASAGPTAQAHGTDIVASDAAVSNALRSASAAVLPSDWDAALADLSATIAAGARVQSGTATLVATLDRTIPSVGNRLADTLTALASNPAVQLIPLSQAMGVAPSAATVIDQPQAADRVSRAGQMIQGESAERAFTTVASDPAAITSERRLQLLTLLSSEWENNLSAWPKAADAFTTASIDLRNSVYLVKSSNFLLVADNGQYLPVTVNNGLDQPITVYITARSQSALLAIDEPRVTLPVGAGTQKKVDVPVHSLSNGKVEVTVSMTSATDVPIGAPVTSEVNVQAGWETPIIVAVAILVVLVFGAGIVRTILRRRKTSAVAETPDD